MECTEDFLFLKRSKSEGERRYCSSLKATEEADGARGEKLNKSCSTQWNRQTVKPDSQLDRQTDRQTKGRGCWVGGVAWCRRQGRQLGLMSRQRAEGGVGKL